MYTNILAIAATLALVGCHQYPPRDCSLSSGKSVELRSPLDDSRNRSEVLGEGVAITGQFKPVGALRVDSVGVQLGYGGGAAGTVSLELCQGGRCVAGMAELKDPVDNAYFQIMLDQPMPLSFGAGTVSYTLRRTSGTQELYAWIYPAAGPGTQMQSSAGESAEVLNLMLRQH